MKNLLTVVFFFTLISAVSAQEVAEVQKTLLTKITATWCPNCGTWGWTFFEDIIVDNQDKAVFIGAHHSGDLQSSPGAAFAENFMAPYQPFFYAGNVDLNVSGGNISAKRTEVQDLVNANYDSAPLANVGFDAEIDGSGLNINSKVRFFQDGTGDYYLGVYIIEHHIVNVQASNSTMAEHPYVIREALTASDFGFSLQEGPIAAGTEFTESFSLQLNPEWNTENLRVVGIIWNKNGDTYEFVNTNEVFDIMENVVAVEDLIKEDVLEAQLFPTVTNDLTTLNLDLKESALDVNIQVINLQGQIVETVFSGQLTQGNQSFEISATDFASGVYLVRLQTAEGKFLTEKFIVQ